MWTLREEVVGSVDTEGGGGSVDTEGGGGGECRY